MDEGLLYEVSREEPRDSRIPDFSAEPVSRSGVPAFRQLPGEVVEFKDPVVETPDFR